MRLIRFLLDPQGGEGGNNTPPPTPAPAPTPESKAPDLVKAVESLVSKHGDTTAALRVLLAENYQYRDQLRETKSRLPGEGSRVLTAEEARILDVYSGLGKPEDLKKIKAEHGTLSSEVTTFKRDTELRSVAEKTGVKFSVLKTLAGSLDFSGTVKVKDAKTQKETEVLAVKDGDAEPIAFEAYAADKWKDFLPALKADGKAIEPPSLPPRRNALPLPPVTRPAEQAQATGFRMPRV